MAEVTRRRYRHRLSRRGRRAIVRALLHHQAAGHGNGPGHQPHHRRAAPRPALGGPRDVGSSAPRCRLTLPLESAVGDRPAIDMTAEPTVFVVDDNPGVRKSLQALVEAGGPGGRDVCVARGVPRGLRRAATRLPRPRRPPPGGQRSRICRTSSAGGMRRSPIIVMTGYADVPTSVRAFKGGAIDFLRKPVPPKTLIERIREAIEVDAAHSRRSGAARHRGGSHRAAHPA